MQRKDIIDCIGSEYYSYTQDSESGEFFYNKEFPLIGKAWKDVRIENPYKANGLGYYMHLDIRMVNPDKKLTICIETKGDYKKSKGDLQKAKEQLAAYMKYEKIYSGNRIIGILANTKYDEIMMYQDSVDDNNLMKFDTIVSMEELCSYLFPTIVNKKESVMEATYQLNEILHGYGIEAKVRGQLVGTCLLALKNGLDYENNSGQPRTASSVIAEIKTKLESLLNKDINKAEKLVLLSKNVLDNERVRKLSDRDLHEILSHVATKILPYINDETTAGQDILNLFFTTFNKYVDKDDKNQAFTPDHITHFMCKITGVNYESRVLDPCCGSGAFLVRALVEARNSCNTRIKDAKDKADRIESIHKQQIYGIEYSEKPFGLSTTNMLIHGDGNTNIKHANCFDLEDWIVGTVKPTVVLMNPPYNAQRIGFPEEILDSIKVEVNKKGKEIKTKIFKTYSTNAWPKKDGKPAKEDPTKGLCFVEYVSDCLQKADLHGTKLAVLLPLQCAIATKGILLRAKENLLKYNTLEAVFTLPSDMFHPGASANACCMLFTMGEPHYKTKTNDFGDEVLDFNSPRKQTFFGYYKEDGFVKKKNLGRVERTSTSGDSIWKSEIEPKWLQLFIDRDVEVGMSAKRKVTASDEWLCEAYMETDYSTLTDADFQQTINNYLAYLVKEGYVYED